MAKRPLENKKNSASKLANLIMSGSKDKKQIIALKQELGLVGPISNNPGPDATSNEIGNAAGERRIGIWKPALIDGQEFYVRDSSCMNEYPLWAKVHKIPPKGNKRRICLLGESVARGFLYDPAYTPALVLERILNLNRDIDAFPFSAEVIDLARTDCSMRELKKIISSCFALQPDALVIFAGNNWSADIELSDDDLREIIEILDSESRFKGLKSILEGKYLHLVSNFMTYISQVSKTHHIPVVILIPEYNLLDWSGNEIEKRLLFPMEQPCKWYRLKAEAEQLMEQGNLEGVESLCEEMIVLNETNHSTFELLAQCKLKKNLYEDALKYFRLAHDTTIFQLSSNPGIISITQETLLKLANRYDIPVIDLAAIFNHQDDGIKPNRQLFLDYCHLSAEGIKIAMTHTAKSILFQSTGSHIAPDESGIKKIEPNNEVVGNAHFFSAIHNAHWGQSYEIVYYHCLKALQASKTIEQLMIHYASMASKHIPWIISKDFEEIVKTRVLNHYYLNQPAGEEIMDIILVDAITSALSTVGIDIKDRIKRLRKEEHGFNNGKINLLESYYHLTYNIKNLGQKKHYYQAFDVHSEFFLVSQKSTPFSLHLTCRVPLKNEKDQWLKLTFNNVVISKLPACEKWRTHTIKIPREMVNDGINIIIIQWPVIHRWPTEGRKDDESLFSFLLRKMKPIFGEIHMFSAYEGGPGV